MENSYSCENRSAAILVFQFHGRKLIQKGILLPLSSRRLCRKKCYISKGIQPIFRKLSFCWKMWKIGIWAENFMSAAILVLQWQGASGKFEISQFQAVHCVRKNAISPKVFNRFSKTFHPLKDVENRYLRQKFHGRSYFSFAMARWKLFSGGKIRNFPLSSCTLCQKKCYITKGIQPIFKNFPSAERCGK